MMLLRNLCYGAPDEIRDVIAWAGGREAFLALLAEKLDPAAAAEQLSPTLREHALFTLCNLASGARSPCAAAHLLVSGSHPDGCVIASEE
jgi:hypothetical protein